MAFSSLKHLFKMTFKEWLRHGAPRLGASLSFYTVLSLAPLLIIAVAIAGAFFGQQAVEGRIVEQAQALIGAQGAQIVQSLLRSAAEPTTGVIAAALGVIVLLFGASGVFGELRAALNIMWDAQPQKKGFAQTVIRKLFSFGMVVSAGFLLLVSLVVSAALSAAGEYLGQLLGMPASFLQVTNILVSLIIITGIFAIIYRVIPDVKLSWGDVWIGAAMTALLFMAGQLLIGIYLGHASIGSAYGTAGSLLVILVWVYYSAQIFLFGAEFTHQYATLHGTHKRTESAEAAKQT